MKLIILIFLILLIIIFLIFTILFKNNKELFESIYYLENTLFLQQRNNDEERVQNCLGITNDFKCNSLYPFDNDNFIIDSVDSDALNSYTKVYIPKGKKGDAGDIGIQGPVSIETNNFTHVNKINTQNDILPINVTNGAVNINTKNPIMLLDNKSICKNFQGEKFCFNLNKLNLTLLNLNSLNTIQ